MKKKLKVGLCGYRDLKEDELEVALYLIEKTQRYFKRKESNKELIVLSTLSSIDNKKDYTIIIDFKHKEIILNEDLLTQQEKFRVMTIEFSDIYVHYEVFARKLGVVKSTVNNWERVEGKNIQQPAIRAKICTLFGLRPDIWIEEFENEVDFANDLPRFKQIKKVKTMTNKEKIDSAIIGKRSILTGVEEELKDRLSKEENISYPIEDMDKRTPAFLFELVKLLKKKSQIKDALSLLDKITTSSSSFKYTYSNEINLQRAVLLSHSSINNWNEAIDILNYLYSGSKYHLEEQEVLTLLASNYKRKALTDALDPTKWLDKESVDRDLLTNAITLYYNSYDQSEDSEKYYDAINLAYVIKIADCIELDLNELDSDIANLEIERLYNELHQNWSADDSNWWEVFSESEFLMLLGKTDVAISKVYDYLEFEYENDMQFNVDITLRQLEMYLHFSADKNAVEFYDKVKEALEAL